MFQRSLWNRWRSLFHPWQEMDWVLFLTTVVLTVGAAVVIYSTEVNQDTNFGWQHGTIGALGIAIALGLARWRYEILIQWKWWIYGITNLSLIAVMAIGTVGGGAQRWISVGGFHIQPSEFAKLGVIITLAALLHDKTASSIQAVSKTLAVVAVPWALVFLQPDLGTSLVFGAITLGMLYWGNANPGWLILLASPIVSGVLFGIYMPGWFLWVALMGVVAWLTIPTTRYASLAAVSVNFLSGKLGQFLWESVLQDYQKDRLILFLNPEKDPLGGGYHLIQSRIAIGAGGVYGKGLFNGTQTQLNFIPEQHTDFIFSAIGEELGFVGAIFLLLAFWLICLRLVAIAQTAKDNFGSLLAIGVLSMLVFQAIVNIGMTIGLAPVTGIPLPWISYGRSALLTNFMAIGVVESVANHRQRRKF
ncbi:rod shape-determining protein RodA [Oxynema sp. CENA135]|uniref:rod shape-determining protein RodA n=1 Tax=Oxynema sp. CENA135 TaxID=984206 RepID=UPI00190B9711|nr:rod shape-determining protein RodA [Oxynema sp. CENA135]MBK4729637.1 rod shape-determining protein RodA [Oxynema sp. CENA135]